MIDTSEVVVDAFQMDLVAQLDGETVYGQTNIDGLENPLGGMIISGTTMLGTPIEL
jgi:hypothetical protein